MWRYQPQSDNKYLGNIWGWKFSVIGGLIILTLIALAALTAHQRGRPLLDNGGRAPVDEPVIPAPRPGGR